MRYKTCPQCGIYNFYLKNISGDSLLVKVSKEGTIVPKDNSIDLDNYNTDIIYCLGCSWSGTPRDLK